jgi:hypothetical protein
MIHNIDALSAADADPICVRVSILRHRHGDIAPRMPAKFSRASTRPIHQHEDRLEVPATLLTRADEVIE